MVVWPMRGYAVRLEFPGDLVLGALVIFLVTRRHVAERKADHLPGLPGEKQQDEGQRQRVPATLQHQRAQTRRESSQALLAVRAIVGSLGFVEHKAFKQERPKSLMGMGLLGLWSAGRC